MHDFTVHESSHLKHVSFKLKRSPFRVFCNCFFWSQRAIRFWRKPSARAATAFGKLVPGQARFELQGSVDLRTLTRIFGCASPDRHLLRPNSLAQNLRKIAAPILDEDGQRFQGRGINSLAEMALGESLRDGLVVARRINA